MPEPIRIFDGPGADHAAAKLREAGIMVEIVHPPNCVSFWDHAMRVANGSKANPVLHIGGAALELWRQLTNALAAEPWIDPEIVALMDAGERCWSPLDFADHVRPGLARDEGDWFLASGPDLFAKVSDRFAAAWLAEFDGAGS